VLQRCRELAHSSPDLDGVDSREAAPAVGLYTWQVEPHWLEIVRRPMPLPDLPPSLDGRTVLQLSDLRVGPVDPRYLERSLRRAAELEPDFVVITGDFVTYRGKPDNRELARILEHLPHGRLGTVASLGNHDFGPGWRQMAVADTVTKVMNDAVVRVLRNEIQVVAGLHFVGLGDYWSPDFGATRPLRSLLSAPPSAAGDPELELAAATLARVQGAMPTLVLCHNPDALDEPIWSDVSGWVLAGHTHGGQCKPPFLPPPVLPVRNKRFTSGIFAMTPRRTLYINRGLGHYLKVRFNVWPEITLFTLQTQSSRSQRRIQRRV
jgi:hypothetical protein